MTFKKFLLMICAVMVMIFSGGWFWETEKYLAITPKEFISLYNEQLKNLAKADGKDYSNFEITKVEEKKRGEYIYSVKNEFFLGIGGITEGDNLAAVLTSSVVKENIYIVATAMVYAVPKSAAIPNVKEKLIKAIDTVPKSVFAQGNSFSENGVRIDVTCSGDLYLVTIIDEKSIKSKK